MATEEDIPEDVSPEEPEGMNPHEDYDAQVPEDEQLTGIEEAGAELEQFEMEFDDYFADATDDLQSFIDKREDLKKTLLQTYINISAEDKNTNIESHKKMIHDIKVPSQRYS